MKIFSVIVCCYNVDSSIEQCALSLSTQSLNSNLYEVIFVNDCSSDSTLKKLEMFNTYPNLTIIDNLENKGLALSRNIGIKQSDSETKFIALLDGDMVPQNNWLESFLKFFNDKNVVAVMGDNIPPPNYPLSDADKYYFGKLRGARKLKDGDIVPLQYQLFGNAVIRKSVFSRVGYFNESFELYGGEDTDFAAKIYSKNIGSFVFSRYSDTLHFHFRSLEQFCSSMNKYGKYNLPKLVKSYPKYVDKFGITWFFGIRYKLLFNPLLVFFLKIIYFFYKNNYMTRYFVILSVAKGYRQSCKK